MSQIALPLTSRPSSTDYLVTEANAEVAHQLKNWAHWPYKGAVLFGSQASGKTSMGQVFARDSKGILVDDAHLIEPAEIFHKWNQAQQESRPILIIFPDTVALDAIALPDLKSRLAASQHIIIGQPDAAMISALFEKLGRMRGMDITPRLAEYAAARCERSYQAVSDLVTELDRITLEQRKPVTMAMMRDLFGRTNDHDDDDSDQAGAA
ncbi:HdaA/DnaA family protein [Alterisphingorhabdus coralli]|uniref:Chromosomal replication initiator DnaA n=1 Tax=Alterisphingorhabdus coralli TaxID=3071408 RepID=A0AA97F6Z7_9SPHN|nr:chromosomal replication initiator DnaA [Parasphingorhabdus sp. SCSIO 66989]WOE74247.1 chromosomal replication initiator DnaA [Parasphingorhabdus sp. SCSIO 66989]